MDKVSYKSYVERGGSGEIQPNRKVSYKSYTGRRRVNPMIEAIRDIEDRLMVSDLQWTISYHPNTKSYNIFITEPTESNNGEDDTENH